MLGILLSVSVEPTHAESALMGIMNNAKKRGTNRRPFLNIIFDFVIFSKGVIVIV